MSDDLTGFANGYGADIAIQRADMLDQAACEYLQELYEAGLTPMALDAGCGLGGQAHRMASAGARVLGVDIAEQACRKQHDSILYHVQSVTDFPKIGERTRASEFDVVVMQRMIHYLHPIFANDVIKTVFCMIKPGGRFFVSASGLGSELGNGYLQTEWAERFSKLELQMAKKHDIQVPVCLYELKDLVSLVRQNGFTILSADISPFGNIKVSAKK